MEEKEVLIEEIKRLISCDKSEVIEINPNYLEYFSHEELLQIKEQLAYKKEHYEEQTRTFVNELYEKTKKVEL